VIEFLKFYLADICFGIILLIIGLSISSSPPYHRYFQERDPALSFPLVAKESVPIWLLAIITYVFPLVVIIFTQILWHFTPSRWKKTDSASSSYTHYILMPHLALMEGIAVTVWMTQVLKNFCGRPRPNFYAMCNYKGYRDALATGNFTLYNSLTTAGVQGDIAFCLEPDPANVREAMYSFPSGHSSAVFAGMTILTLYLLHIIPRHFLRGTFKTPSPIRLLPIKIAIMIICMGSAWLVACSRTRDYWHNFDDILGGSVLGFCVSCFVFWLNHARLKDMEGETKTGNDPAPVSLSDV